MNPARVIVVDDYEPFRRLVCSMLQERAEVQVVGQASDGLEAIQKAEELRPDLILLDVGLPKLNGIAVVRRLAGLRPEVKILMVSQESSSDVVREALELGAIGYVHKTRIHGDLFPALEAALCDKQFVSGTLQVWEPTEIEGTQGPHQHEILVYSDETVLLESLTVFIASALRAGNSAVVIATKTHLDYLAQALKKEGLDVDGASRQGSYIPLDHAQSFSAIMEDGLPVPARFLGSMGGLMEVATRAATAEHPRVAFCGEGLGLLWAEGKTDAALQLEQLCNELAKKFAIDMLCAYPSSSPETEKSKDSFKLISAQHSVVCSR